MSADIELDWNKAKAGNEGKGSLYLASVKPVSGYNLKLEGLVLSDSDPVMRHLDIPIVNSWIILTPCIKDLILEGLNSERLGRVMLVLETVIAQRNKARLSEHPNSKIVSEFMAVSAMAEGRGGYQLSILTSPSLHPFSNLQRLIIVGDQIGLVDFWEDGVKPLFTNISPRCSKKVRPLDGYARRLQKNLKLFTLEPMDYKAWKEETESFLKV